MANGNVTDAVKILRQKWNRKIGRKTIYDMMKLHPDLQEVRFQAEGVSFDVSDFGVKGRVEKGVARDQRLVWAKLYSKHGASGDAPQRIEITGADGQPVQHEHEVHADGGLSKAQIAALDREELRILLAAERLKYAKRVATAIAAAGTTTGGANSAAGGSP